MLVRTRNTVYTLKDMGDGGFLISGHDKFCPTPVLVTLKDEVKVGQRMRFSYVDHNPCPWEGNTVITTPVVRID